MATYNGEKYIKEQLDSILCQLNSNDEVIISDDNSKDGTLNIIRNFKDKRIKIFRNEGKGLIDNFENSLAKSSGDVIFLADQDDIWCENKVKIFLEDFKNGYDLILSDGIIFDSETNIVLQDSFFKFNKSKKGIVNNFFRNSYMGCCMAFTSEVKVKILPFPRRIPMHDIWIGLVAELYFKVNFNKNKLIRYRKHFNNVSTTSSGKSKYSFFCKIKFRINLINGLIMRYLNFVN
jgi:glycosyltransferase involved in cell wall biosynthesis